MKNKNDLKKIVFVTLALVLLAMGVRRCTEDRTLLDVSIGHSRDIDLTPAQIRSIQRIGQWEFLAITDEELVDTIRHRTFQRNDRLVRIYRGTLRLGIDLAQCQDGWVQTRGDTAFLRLPPIRLLSSQFIDEARTRAFYERGTWDARSREQLYQKAARQMRQRALTPENIRQAEDNARAQMSNLFRSFGFQTVEVTFTTSGQTTAASRVTVPFSPNKN
ncbi:MAG: DUF4230 domain-containing protein [Bacteroidaceae bacterium]|nr:DUF4230 domain-containing protein [Bacteroidaceae bacterium]